MGNFMLGTTKFNTEEEPGCCQTVRGQMKEKHIILVNTPDLLHPAISVDKLREFNRTCVALCAPGPHVFLLVLQPEHFTDQQTKRLQSILGNFSGKAFHHSLVLIPTPRNESSGFVQRQMQYPQLGDVVKRCRDTFLWQRNLENQRELLTAIGKIVKQNNGNHVSCKVFKTMTSVERCGHQSLTHEQSVTINKDPIKGKTLETDEL